MTDAPSPIPTDGVWTGDSSELPNWDAMPRRNRRRRRRSAYPLWLKYLGWCFGLALILIAVQIAYQALRSDPRDPRTFAERQLRLSALRPNERVLAEVSVWQRPAIDYFQATRGLLVLTDAPGDSAHPIGGRLIYLGLEPRDPLSAADAPPTFDTRDWAIDTTAAITPKRTLLYLSRGVRLGPPDAHLTLGVPSPASDDADKLMIAANRKYAELRAVGWQRREARRASDRAASLTAFNGKREWFHTVRRGEAVASVAKMFNTTPDQIRQLNGLVGDRIRIGQTLKVKALTTTAVPYPSGVTPETAPKGTATALAPPPSTAR